MTTWNESKSARKGKKYVLDVFMPLSSVKETPRYCFLMTFLNDSGDASEGG